MAHLIMNFESSYLHGNTEISVILPDKPREASPIDFYGSGKTYPVLWLFHGSFGDHTDWVRRSNIETYACENNLIVVMPSALNTNYTDWMNFADGYAFKQFFFQELMPMVYGWFPASSQKEDNFIAGLSMGGEGAMKFALLHPELFAKAAALSSSPRRYDLDIAGLTGSRALKFQNTIQAAGGLEAFLASEDNTWKLVSEADPNKIPPLYCAIGGDDPGMERFERFQKLAKERNLNVTFEVIPGFRHEWRVWEITIQKGLKFFGFSSHEGGNAHPNPHKNPGARLLGSRIFIQQA